MHCLIVEDDADLAASWHLNLHDLNTEASEAHSRSQATGRLLIGGDGVAIIDLNLPDGHGLEVAEVVLPRMVDCPMVVLTGSGDFPDEADLRPLRQHRGRVPQNGRHAGYACPRPAFGPQEPRRGGTPAALTRRQPPGPPVRERAAQWVRRGERPNKRPRLGSAAQPGAALSGAGPAAEVWADLAVRASRRGACAMRRCDLAGASGRKSDRMASMADCACRLGALALGMPMMSLVTSVAGDVRRLSSDALRAPRRRAVRRLHGRRGTERRFEAASPWLRGPFGSRLHGDFDPGPHSNPGPPLRPLPPRIGLRRRWDGPSGAAPCRGFRQISPLRGRSSAGLPRTGVQRRWSAVVRGG